jgi:hypothetical protein
MTLAHRRRQPFTRRIVRRLVKRLIIVATEGAETEKQYFNSLFGAYHMPRVLVEVLPTQKGFSAPQYVLERLRDVKNDQDLNLDENDELWLVVDRDKWNDNQLEAAVADAISEGFHVAVSNPCFEVWLILHICAFPPSGCQTSRECKMYLRSIGGADRKDRLSISRLKGGIDSAHQRATALDVDTSPAIPNAPGTRVYKLIESIQKR